MRRSSLTALVIFLFALGMTSVNALIGTSHGKDEIKPMSAAEQSKLTSRLQPQTVAGQLNQTARTATGISNFTGHPIARIAILDSGVRTSHQFFPGANIHVINYVNSTEFTRGTAFASLAYDAAPQVEIYAMVVVDQNKNFDFDAATRAMQDIISLSAQGPISVAIPSSTSRYHEGFRQVLRATSRYPIPLALGGGDDDTGSTGQDIVSGGANPAQWVNELPNAVIYNGGRINDPSDLRTANVLLRSWYSATLPVVTGPGTGLVGAYGLNDTQYANLEGSNFAVIFGAIGHAYAMAKGISANNIKCFANTATPLYEGTAKSRGFINVVGAINNCTPATKPSPTVRIDGPTEAKITDRPTLTAVANDPAGEGIVAYEWRRAGSDTLVATTQAIGLVFDTTGVKTYTVKVFTRDGRWATATHAITVKDNDGPPVGSNRPPRVSEAPVTIKTQNAELVVINAKLDDPDGDVVRCQVFPGNNDDSGILVGGQVSYQTHYVQRRDPYIAELRCNDGRGGEVRHYIQVTSTSIMTIKKQPSVAGSSNQLNLTMNNSAINDPNLDAWVEGFGRRLGDLRVKFGNRGPVLKGPITLENGVVPDEITIRDNYGSSLKARVILK